MYHGMHRIADHHHRLSFKLSLALAAYFSYLCGSREDFRECGGWDGHKGLGSLGVPQRTREPWSAILHMPQLEFVVQIKREVDSNYPGAKVSAKGSQGPKI